LGDNCSGMGRGPICVLDWVTRSIR
jgi:hypothetical protein